MIDGFGKPIDGGPAIQAEGAYSLYGVATNPLDREHITQPLVTGIRAIDSLLPCGKGQRIGIFGGSGVGKSTLLGSMSRHNSADVTVIGMIGERNREVRGFLENELGPEGSAALGSGVRDFGTARAACACAPASWRWRWPSIFAIRGPVCCW